MLEALSLLLVLARSAEALDAIEMGPDLEGPYCARLDKCCPGRVDECSVPILGTLCYCDAFCSNRSGTPDCCPDYHSHCNGGGYGYGRYVPAERPGDVYQPPPIPLRDGCIFNGRRYTVTEKTRSNCNDCQCIQMNGRAEMLCSRDRCLIDTEMLEIVNREAGSKPAAPPPPLPVVSGPGASGGGRGHHHGGQGHHRARPARWTATNYTEFWGRSLEEGLSLRLGTLSPSEAVLRMHPLHHTLDPPNLPASFDARVAWPRAVSPVQDQGWCGASWALSTAAVASDRFAIMSLGHETPSLAAQHLLDCNNRKQHGCNGGHLDRAWYFTRKFGLVPDACYPWTGREDKCHVPKKATLDTARCPLRAATSRKAKTELYRMGPVYRLAGEEDIMREIIRSGPVQATMRVYQDLFSYQSGIYEHMPMVEVARTGFHSVRLVGWGEEDGVKYWVAANSWGEWWGERGYFRIRRGTDECDIEKLVLAAWAHTHIHRDLDNTITM
ncbi:Tubulointerstitial nephritis antigen-like [Frankliniella fusca]|uniref:Tubulointerstitial nephritis antigen-like n=1 Tax=Frankliniella fusca TaxID=407009 RepID=A0AAE1LK94_9NEOP|nr:Tubulointerstitial nephritis antigen-like [Frankliniella fusca]